MSESLIVNVVLTKFGVPSRDSVIYVISDELIESIESGRLKVQAQSNICTGECRPLKDKSKRLLINEENRAINITNIRLDKELGVIFGDVEFAGPVGDRLKEMTTVQEGEMAMRALCDVVKPDLRIVKDIITWDFIPSHLKDVL